MAPRNRTLTLTDTDAAGYETMLLTLSKPAALTAISNRIVCQDMLEAAAFLPAQCIDLLVLDPPYNLTKTFGSEAFYRKSVEEYSQQLDRWVAALLPALKPTASIYICGDWLSSTSIHLVASRYFKVRSRITWEREKGRGANANWKNASEDIWFCTMGNDYTFNAAAVKLKRRVLAPYRDTASGPKDWEESKEGNFRLTFPSNLWTDITVPFWSMPENTEHPTQKPEKILAKLLLASTREHDMVLDPFMGSGTTAAVAQKLGRRFIGIEKEKKYCLLAQKRLALAAVNPDIQGYNNGVFWERNTLALQKSQSRQTTAKPVTSTRKKTTSE